MCGSAAGARADGGTEGHTRAAERVTFPLMWPTGAEPRYYRVGGAPDGGGDLCSTFTQLFINIFLYIYIYLIVYLCMLYLICHHFNLFI